MTSTQLGRLRQLSRRELGLLVRALWLLPAAKVSLRAFGYQRTRRTLEKAFPVSQQTFETVAVTAAAERTRRMVRAAAAHGPWPAACLPRSLVLWALLRRQGLDPEIRFGARKQAGVFEAHSWVVLGEKVLDAGLGGNETPFVPFEILQTQP